MKKFKFPTIIFVHCMIFIPFLHAGIIIKGPYLQNVTQNEITIMWESSGPSIGELVYGKPGNLNMTLKEKQENTFHEITLTGLSPETTYQYKIISDVWLDNEQRLFSLKTAVPPNRPFSFITYGDNKSGPFMHKKNSELMATKNIDFVIHNGDLVERGYIYRQWELLFFTPAQSLLNKVPYYPLLGNHERHAEYYYKYFSLPNNETYYSFDYGNAHFICLDSEDITKNKKQLDWLINDLKNNRLTWTIVCFHHPPFTSGGNYYTKDRIERKNLLHPIFEKYKVDFVFNGHDHDYERSYPIKTKTSDHAVTYIVCGNGGTPMRYVGKREWTAYSERVFGFVKIDIDGFKLDIASYNIDNQIIDRLTLDKNDPQSIDKYYSQVVAFEDINDPVEAAELVEKTEDLIDNELYREALVWAEKAWLADSTCAEALAMISEINFELGNNDAAIEAAEKCLKVMSVLPDPYELLVEHYTDIKQFDKALALVGKWITIEADQTDPWESLAEIWEAKGDINKTEFYLIKALSVLPSDSDLNFVVAEFYLDNGHKEKALEYYKKCLYWFIDEEEEVEIIKAREMVKKLTGDL